MYEKLGLNSNANLSNSIYSIFAMQQFYYYICKDTHHKLPSISIQPSSGKLIYENYLLAIDRVSYMSIAIQHFV